MKCSLLTLSTYIDAELSQERRSEVDAHLVGCARCSAGTASLRDEKTRVGQLARVRVPHASATLMLEQVGITGAPAVASPARPALQPPPAPSDQLPWQATAAASPSPALPWTPRRPDPVRSANEQPIVPAVPADVQPDLPFDRLTAEAPPEVEAAAPHPSEPLGDEWNDDIAWPQTEVSTPGWEADLPAPLHTDDPGEPWDHPDIVSGVPAYPPPAPPVPGPRPQPSAPVRAAAAAGPAAVWSRFRDAVAVRLALARGADAVEASLQITSGPAPARRVEPPPGDAVELTGTAGPSVDARIAAHKALTTTDRPAPVIDHVAPAIESPLVEPPVMAQPAAAVDTSSRLDASAPAMEPPTTVPPAIEPPAIRHRPRWNAFAGSSYARRADDPEDDDVVEALRKQAAVPSRSLGRHSRAVARDQVTLAMRLRRLGASMVAAVRSGGGSAAAGLRSGGASAATAFRTGGTAAAGGAHRAADSASGASPDRRILAAIAGVVVIAGAALFISRGSSSPAPTATATHHTPAAAAGGAAPAPNTSAPAHPSTSAPAHPSTSAPAPTTGSLTGTQTFGSNGTGFQLKDIRYGIHPGDLRVVFDLGMLSGSSGTSPRAVVAFSDPQTMLITFSGVIPAGSTGSPPPGGAIASVTLVSTKGGTAQYRVKLTKAVTFSGGYLTGPVRFVLDLH